MVTVQYLTNEVRFPSFFRCLPVKARRGNVHEMVTQGLVFGHDYRRTTKTNKTIKKSDMTKRPRKLHISNHSVDRMLVILVSDEWKARQEHCPGHNIVVDFHHIW